MSKAAGSLRTRTQQWRLSEEHHLCTGKPTLQRDLAAITNADMQRPHPYWVALFVSRLRLWLRLQLLLILLTFSFLLTRPDLAVSRLRPLLLVLPVPQRLLLSNFAGV
jgi:hypothetical protein